MVRFVFGGLVYLYVDGVVIGGGYEDVVDCCDVFEWVL